MDVTVSMRQYKYSNWLQKKQFYLPDILPKKILASKYLKMLEKEKRDGEVGEDDEEDEEEEDEDKAVDEDVGS